MSPLTVCQVEALDAYYELTAKFPHLLSGRQRRPILHDRQVLEKYAEQNGCVLGVAASTHYSYFVVDLVESTDATGNKFVHPYQRVIDRAEMAGGVASAVIATIANPSLGRIGDIVLLEQERHATGLVQIGIPRGFGRKGLSGEANALRELREETGYIGEKATPLATVYVDNGMTGATVTFYHISAIGQQSAEPETEEAMVGTQLLSPHEAWQQILSGDIQDSFTIQALALFERR